MNENNQYNEVYNDNYDGNINSPYYVEYKPFLLVLFSISTLCALNYFNNTYKKRKYINNKLKLLLLNSNECAICLDKIENNKNIILLNCDHYFHKNCLDNWFVKSKTCPICRNDVI